MPRTGSVSAVSELRAAVDRRRHAEGRLDIVDLADAVISHSDVEQVAGRLDVDERTLRDRFAGLRDDDAEYLFWRVDQAAEQDATP